MTVRPSRHRAAAARFGVLVAVVALLLPALAAVTEVAAVAAPAPVARPVDTVAHDPTMVEQDGWYYVVITGDSGAPHTYLPMKRSRDKIHWTELGPVFTTLPAWVTSTLGVTPADAWAPDLSFANGQWRLYYAASQFGTTNSVIGLATTPTLDPSAPGYGWVDRGLVIRSQPGDSYNAIDPEFAADADGGAWLAYGSFFGGLVMRRLDATTGLPSATDTAQYPLAHRVDPDAEEGPSITAHDGWYYLFDAFDFCCRSTNSDYRVMVGRSRSITGPYVDRAGVPLLDGGGTEVVRGSNEFVGTGGADVLVDGDATWLVNHYYDATSEGTPRLNVRPLTWSRDGWPVVGDPLNPSRTIGHGDAYLKIVSQVSPSTVVEDSGCGYEGANIALWTDLGNSCQQWQWHYRGNGGWSILNRFSNKVAEVAACDNVDGGNVAQWGWLGFLPNNDCQRWTPAPSVGGWTVVRTTLPGARALDVAGCGTAPGTNIDITTRGVGACQKFRFEPVGPVLLASTVTNSAVVSDCASAPSTRLRPGAPVPPCASWQFRPVGGADYTVQDTGTGRLLTVASCNPSPARACTAGVDGFPALSTTPALGGPPAGTTRWTLQPNAAGSWTMSNAATGLRVTVQVLQP